VPFARGGTEAAEPFSAADSSYYREITERKQGRLAASGNSWKVLAIVGYADRCSSWHGQLHDSDVRPVVRPVSDSARRDALVI